MNQTLTLADAIAYVIAIETQWDMFGRGIVRAEPSREIDGAIDVHSIHNVWTVWRLETGEIYGEC